MSALKDGRALVGTTIDADGGVYVGSTIGERGRITHTILLPGEKADVTWPDALSWAKEQGGDLPTQAELTMLSEHHRLAESCSPRVLWSSDREGDLAGARVFAMEKGLTYWTTRNVNELIDARAVRRVVEGGY